VMRPEAQQSLSRREFGCNQYCKKLLREADGTQRAWRSPGAQSCS
jgi:hypothetical protein